MRGGIASTTSALTAMLEAPCLQHARHHPAYFVRCLPLKALLCAAQMAFASVEQALHSYDVAQFGVAQNLFGTGAFWFTIIVCMLISFGHRYIERSYVWLFRPQVLRLPCALATPSLRYTIPPTEHHTKPTGHKPSMLLLIGPYITSLLIQNLFRNEPRVFLTGLGCGVRPRTPGLDDPEEDRGG